MKSSKWWLILFDLLLLTTLSFAFISPLLIGNILLTAGDIQFLHYPAAFELSNALQEGYFYPRWMPHANLGLGQPVFLYYPPLLFYVISLFNLFIGNIWLSLKISLFFFTWLTGIVTYTLLYRSTGRIWSLTSATALMLTPMFFLTLYYNQEIAWYAAIPASVLVLYLSIESHKNSLVSYLFLSISVAALVLTHSLSAFMLLLCLLFLPIIDVIYRKNTLTEVINQAFHWYCAVTLGVGIGLIHLLPAFLDWNLISTQHYASLDWRSSFFFPTVTYFVFGNRWFLFQWYVPLVLFFSNLLVTIYLIRYSENFNNEWMVCMKLTFVGWLAFFFGSELAYPLWYFSDSIMQKVQIPTRFLYIASLAIPLATTLAAYRSWCCKASKLWRINLITALAISILLTLILLLKLLVVDIKIVDMKPDYVLSGRFALKSLNPATLGKNWDIYFEHGGLAGECRKKSLNCHLLLSKSQDREWLIESDHADAVILPVPAFPAWQVLLNGVSLETQIDTPTGLIQVPVTPGKNLIHIGWQGTPSEHLGTLLSVISTGILAILFIIAIWRKRTSALFNYAGKHPGNGSGSH